MSATSSFDKRGAFATARRGGIDAWEIAFIGQKRGAGFPDSAIANMLGRTLPEIKSAPALWPPTVAVLTPEPEPEEPIPPRKPTVTRSRRRMGRRGMPRRIHAMVEQIAAKHGFTLADLIGDSRKAKVAKPRHEAWALIYQIRKPTTLQHLYSLQMIGAWFGGRDHTTILSGIVAHRAHEERMRAGA